MRVAFASQEPSPDAPFAKPWRPEATYTLLGLMVFTYAVQIAFWSVKGRATHDFFFVIDHTWFLRGWTLLTSTLAHAPDDPTHLLFNGLFLYFFGPTVERMLGQRRFFTLFFLAGALSGILQVQLAGMVGETTAALGASGALMALFGVCMVLIPHAQILLWGFVPLKLWMAGVGYAVLDVLGAFNPADGIGNFAHLSGLALGLLYGLAFKRELRKRRLQLVVE